MVSISVPLVAVWLRGSMSCASAYSVLAPFLHPGAIPDLRISCGRFVIAHISFTHGQPGPPGLTAVRITWGYIYCDVGPRSCVPHVSFQFGPKPITSRLLVAICNLLQSHFLLVTWSPSPSRLPFDSVRALHVTVDAVQTAFMFSVFNLILFIRTCLHCLHSHPFISFHFYYLLTYSLRPSAVLGLDPRPRCDSST
ncbi:hypothetical protein C8R43DRAFT_530433 [Mycena crocata]|nr:hypothetical protein C8R43DRAFT_530433 [Mycena crocata]